MQVSSRDNFEISEINNQSDSAHYRLKRNRIIDIAIKTIAIAIFACVTVSLILNPTLFYICPVATSVTVLVGIANCATIFTLTSKMLKSSNKSNNGVIERSLFAKKHLDKEWNHLSSSLSSEEFFNKVSSFVGDGKKINLYDRLSITNEFGELQSILEKWTEFRNSSNESQVSQYILNAQEKVANICNIVACQIRKHNSSELSGLF